MIQPKLNEQETAVIMAALTFYADMDNNYFLTEEQYRAACSALVAIEDAL